MCELGGVVAVRDDIAKVTRTPVDAVDVGEHVEVAVVHLRVARWLGAGEPLVGYGHLSDDVSGDRGHHQERCARPAGIELDVRRGRGRDPRGRHRVLHACLPVEVVVREDALARRWQFEDDPVDHEIIGVTEVDEERVAGEPRRGPFDTDDLRCAVWALVAQPGREPRDHRVGDHVKSEPPSTLMFAPVM